MNPAEYAHLALLIGDFAARDDAYVLDSRAHIAETLTPEALAHHWAGGRAVSTYLGTFEDGVAMTHVGAIDLDAGTWEDALPIVKVLGEQKVPALLCPSRRGAHIWTFHTDPKTFGLVQARVVRAALHNAVELSGWPHPTLKAEVFPRRGTNPYSAGALRLPLMAHPKDGEVRPAITPDGTYLTRISEVVDAVADMTSDYPSLWALSGLDDAKTPYPMAAQLGRYAQPRRRLVDAPEVSMLLAGMGLIARPGHTTRCPFHDDKHNSLSLAKDDERVFCKAPHCDLNNDGRGLGSYQLERYLKELAHASSR